MPRSPFPPLLLLLLQPACLQRGDPEDTAGEAVFSLSSPRDGDLLFTGEPVELDLNWLAGQPEPGMVYTLQRTRAADVAWLDGECLASSGSVDFCWSASQVALSSQVTTEPPALPAITADSTNPATTRLTLSIQHGADAPTTVGTVEFIDLGRALYWGDLHAHTNLSHDGCEEQTQDCGPRGTQPAEGFFQTAVDNGLDFAAITDHAEYTLYQRDEGSTPLDIWQEAQRLVAEAEAEFPGFLPILGYEWTYATIQNVDGSRIGGHHSVLFQSAAVCADYRIGYSEDGDVHTRDLGTEIYTNDGGVSALSLQAFSSALDDAAARCSQETLTVIPHHSAMDMPQPVDWTWPENAPDPNLIQLVEILSEHGSSECLDLSAPYCDFGLPETVDPYPAGAVQLALSMGYQLGFTAGTDSHDNRPGSLADGPSCIANWWDSDEDGVLDSLRCHTLGGGLTGALVAGGLGRQSLFAALLARNTLAATSPHLSLAVAALGSDDTVYLPGDKIAAAALPLTLVVRAGRALEAINGELLGMDLVAASSEVLATSTEANVDLPLALDEVDAAYVRLRYTVDGVEQRAWASPFFMDGGR